MRSETAETISDVTTEDPEKLYWAVVEQCRDTMCAFVRLDGLRARKDSHD